MSDCETVSAAIRAALLTAEPRSNAFAARDVARRWRLGKLAFGFETAMPERPAWPAAPELLPPRMMPKRGRGGTEAGRIALWHALAHIEFVAIDLALDMAGRFGAEMGEEFVGDFLSVAADEAMHFALLARKLASLGSHYGALPAHAGLWSSAEATAHDVAARLAIVPMVLEARGLDVTPATLERVRRQGDEQGARILQRILDDEVRHVAVGAKYFDRWCQRHEIAPHNHWQRLVRTYFSGVLRGPFNDSARRRAGLPRSFYAGIAS